MPKILVLLLSVAVIWLAPELSYSQKNYARSAAGCGKLTTNASINVTINGRKDTIKEAKAFFDQQVALIHEHLKKQGVKKVNITSLNYNLNPTMRYDSYGIPSDPEYYQIGGNIQLQLTDEAQAMALAEHLIANKMQASVNVSNYNGGGVCPQEEISE